MIRITDSWLLPSISSASTHSLNKGIMPSVFFLKVHRLFFKVQLKPPIFMCLDLLRAGLSRASFLAEMISLFSNDGMCYRVTFTM